MFSVETALAIGVIDLNITRLFFLILTI